MRVRWLLAGRAAASVGTAATLPGVLGVVGAVCVAGTTGGCVPGTTGGCVAGSPEAAASAAPLNLTAFANFSFKGVTS